MTPPRILNQPITNYPSAIWLREVSDESFNEPDSPALLPTELPAAAEARSAIVVADGQGSDAGRADASRSVMYDPRRFPFYLEMHQEIFPDGVRIRLTAHQAD